MSMTECRSTLSTTFAVTLALDVRDAGDSRLDTVGQGARPQGHAPVRRPPLIEDLDLGLPPRIFVTCCGNAPDGVRNAQGEQWVADPTSPLIVGTELGAAAD